MYRHENQWTQGGHHPCTTRAAQIRNMHTTQRIPALLVVLVSTRCGCDQIWWGPLALAGAGTVAGSSTLRGSNQAPLSPSVTLTCRASQPRCLNNGGDSKSAAKSHTVGFSPKHHLNPHINKYLCNIPSCSVGLLVTLTKTKNCAILVQDGTGGIETSFSSVQLCASHYGFLHILIHTVCTFISRYQ